MNKFMSREAGSQAEPDQALPGGKFSAGKKLLITVPFVILLAAGCNSSSTNNTSQTGQSNTQPASETMASSSMTSNKNQPAMGASSTPTWQSILQLSNNGAKGHYMITSGRHTIYLNSSRDYSSLVGKMVNVSYKGSLDNFTLVDITAK